MNHTPIGKRIAHPGLWGHEEQLSASSTAEQDQHANERVQATVEAISTSDTLIAQLWATISTMRHQTNQWVTLIGKPSAQFLQQLVAAGIQKERIRCILPSGHDASAWAAEQALLLNNSQLVIAWLGKCSVRDQKRLQLAARRSDSINFLFTESNENTPLH